MLELSLKDCQALGDSAIGTEHILLGLVRENEGVASRVLLDFGASADRVRARVLEAVSDPRLLQTRSREKLLARAALVDVHLQASARFAEVAAIVAGAEDEQAAIRALESALEISESHARWIVSSDLRRFTRAQTQASIAMRDELRRAIEALDEPDDA